MQTNGVFPVPAVQRQEEPLSGLRVNQRVLAQVLEVAPGQVLLSINGAPVVARLSAPEESAQLLERQVRHFIVRDIAGPEVTLQLVENQSAAEKPAQPARDLARSVLQAAGMPDSPEDATIAHAILRSHALVMPGLVAYLRDCLSALPGWGSEQANLAAALYAAGLPVTPTALQIATGPLEGTNDSLVALLAVLRELNGRGSQDPRSAALAGQALEALYNAMVLIGSDARAIESRIAAALRAFGCSIANPDSPFSLLDALRWRSGNILDPRATSAIERFCAELRGSSLINLPPRPAPGQGAWIQLSLPVLTGGKDGDGGPDPGGINPRDLARCRLRIACQEEGAATGRINPRHTRLVFQVDLGPGETVGIDLSIAGSSASTEVTVSNSALEAGALHELPGLKSDLEAIGLALVHSHCRVGLVTPPDSLARARSDRSLLQGVDLRA